MPLYKNREKFAEVKKFLEIPEVVVLHGARQVGKTTLMRMTMDELQKSGQTNVFYFDLEKDEFLDLCNHGVEEILKYVKGRQVPEPIGKKIYIFIDEIQYLDNPTGLIKIFYDHYKRDVKLFVSGSSSFAIKSKFKDSLVGRIIDLEIFGLSFKEFLDFKGLSYNLSSGSQLLNAELLGLFREYACYGAYPQVVLTDNLELKEIYLSGIIEKYIYKDIRNLAEIKELEKFNNLVKFLAAQAGGLVNINELSSTLKISRPTIEQYLFILESTYIIKLINPFHKNIRSELSKMPKIYFEDSGILNLLKNRKLSNEVDGQLFENSVYTYLRRRHNVQDVFFWRTANKQEVDFVIGSVQPVPIEVKLSYQDKLLGNLRFFTEQYRSSDAYCVTLHKQEGEFIGVKQIYPWDLEVI